MPEPILTGFLKHLSLERGLSAHTCRSYGYDLKAYLKYISSRSIEPLEATADALSDYVWHLSSVEKLKPRSVYRKMEALRSFYRFHLGEGRLSLDPTRDFKAPHLQERIPRYLRLGEVERLMVAAQGEGFLKVRLSAALELLYATGMRVSELLKLEMDDIHADQRWVRVMGKGKKERLVPIHDRANAALWRFVDVRRQKFDGRKVAREVFVSRRGTALSRAQLWKDLQKISREAKISGRVYAHLFRHTFASHLIQNGADLRAVQEMLGHADLSTTQVYTHLEKSGLKTSHKKFHPKA